MLNPLFRKAILAATHQPAVAGFVRRHGMRLGGCGTRKRQDFLKESEKRMSRGQPATGERNVPQGTEEGEMSAETDRLVRQFLSHRQVSQELASRMPDDKVDFKPWAGAKSFGELVAHIATSHRMFVTIAKGEQWQRPDPAALPKDLPGIRKLLADLTERDVADIRNLSDEQLHARVTGIMNMTMPASSWLHAAREHEIHHKGQLFVYARMNGVEPPFFINRG